MKHISVVYDFINKCKTLENLVGVTEKDISNYLMNELKKKTENIAIWGAGEHTNNLLKLIKTDIISIKGIIDSDKSKCGKKYHNINVYSPKQAKELLIDTIIISSYNKRREIASEIKDVFYNCRTIDLYEKFQYDSPFYFNKDLKDRYRFYIETCIIAEEEFNKLGLAIPEHALNELKNIVSNCKNMINRAEIKERINTKKYFASEYTNPIKEFLLIKKQPELHRRALEKVKKKALNGLKIKVAFFATHASVWKYEGVYRLLDKDERFEPIVVVCPIENSGRDNMLEEMERTYMYFKKNHYNTIRTYDQHRDEYLDINKKVNPDIIFYTSPYKGLIHDSYFIMNFLDRLTCYVPYGLYVVNINREMYDLTFHNLLWKAFYPTETHVRIAKKTARNCGENVINTGYPVLDNLVYGTRIEGKLWENKSFKRVIWAPHHSIEKKGWLDFSSFLYYCEEMLRITEMFNKKVLFAFKPHPILKSKLYNHVNWGKSRTDNYYKKWDKGINTFLHDDNYTDLFNSSDGLIFDSASFTAEYLATGKPSLFTFSDNYNEIILQLNDFGKMALKHHYHGFNTNDIISFIENVCNDEDSKKLERKKFYSKVLRSNKNTSASNNIYNEITSSIFA